MSGIILRWAGGAGGDTLCYLLALQNKDLYMNFSCQGRMDQKTGITLVSGKYDPRYPSLVNMVLAHPNDTETKNINNEIYSLSKKHKKFILKSHWFDPVLDTHADVLDLGYDLHFLPFLIRASIEKSEIVSSNFTYDLKLMKLTKNLDDKQKKKLMIWNLIKDKLKIMVEHSQDKTKIKTSDLFHNQKLIENFLKEREYEINFDVDFFSKWKTKNLKYLPSKKYQEYLDNKDFDYTDPQLDISERYILLALSGKNFVFLD
jgi:hypothetical protein